MEGAIALLHYLPGDKAKSFRRAARKILLRYIAGDETLIHEVNHNAASDHPINQMARESLAAGDKRKRDAEEDPRILALKLHGLQLDNDLKDQELVRARLQNETLVIEHDREKTEIKKVNAEVVQSLKQQLDQVNADSKLDDRTKLLIKDSVINTLVIGNPNTGPNDVFSGDKRWLTVSTRVAELGFKGKDAVWSRAGIYMAQKYRQKYPGQKIGTHDQGVNGAMRPVNSYTYRDVDMMDEAILEAIDYYSTR